MGIPAQRLAQRSREIQAGGRAKGVRHHARPLRHHRLALGGIVHGFVPFRKVGREVLQHAFIELHRQAEKLGGRFASEIIIGRPQAAGDQHHVRPLRRLRNRHADHRAIRHDGLPRHLDAQRRQTLADPRRVRIHRVPEEEFCASINKFDSHVPPPINATRALSRQNLASADIEYKAVPQCALKRPTNLLHNIFVGYCPYP